MVLQFEWLFFLFRVVGTVALVPPFGFGGNGI